VLDGGAALLNSRLRRRTHRLGERGFGFRSLLASRVAAAFLPVVISRGCQTAWHFFGFGRSSVRHSSRTGRRTLKLLVDAETIGDLPVASESAAVEEVDRSSRHPDLPACCRKSGDVSLVRG